MRKNRGYTLLEVLITLAIIMILAAISIPIFANAVRQSREGALTGDCRLIYDAMMRYYADENSFPAEGDFDKVTMAPLSTNGYFSSAAALSSKMKDGALFAYVAPDVGGEDQQFIIVTQHELDPSIIVVAVHTNILTDDGSWVDGVYIITEGELQDAGL